MTIDARLRAYAETPDRWSLVPTGTAVTRWQDDRVCVLQGPNWASLSGANVGAGEVEALVAEVRTLVHREQLVTWVVGPSTRPEDLADRLLELEFGEPSDGAGVLRVLALATPPPPQPAGVAVRMVSNFEDFAAAHEVQWEAFEVPQGRREASRARLRLDFEESIEHGVPVGFVALLDGRPAATALAVPSDRGVFMIGGATVAGARGRGLYRALVRARWDFAAARGTPALITHAKPDTSYPILKRLGFVDVCSVRRLQDRRPPPPEA